MEHIPPQQAQKKLEDVMQKTMATTGEGGTMPSNVEIEEKMQALKMASEAEEVQAADVEEEDAEAPTFI